LDKSDISLEVRRQKKEVGRRKSEVGKRKRKETEYKRVKAFANSLQPAVYSLLII